MSKAAERIGWDEQGAVHLGGTGHPAQEQVALQLRAQQLQDMAHRGPTDRQNSSVNDPAKASPAASTSRAARTRPVP